jgi:hypothetical protein
MSVGFRDTTATHAPKPPCPLTALTHSSPRKSVICIFRKAFFFGETGGWGESRGGPPLRASIAYPVVSLVLTSQPAVTVERVVSRHSANEVPRLWIASVSNPSAFYASAC